MFDATRRGSYRGYDIHIWTHREHDNIKLCHEAIDKNGHRRPIDLSPYGTDDPDLCAALIELNLFDRKDFGLIGPIDREHVEQVWRQRFGDRAMPKAAK